MGFFSLLPGGLGVVETWVARIFVRLLPRQTSPAALLTSVVDPRPYHHRSMGPHAPL